MLMIIEVYSQCQPYNSLMLEFMYNYSSSLLFFYICLYVFCCQLDSTNKDEYTCIAKQKRFPMDTLQNLHKKFRQETKTQILYSAFCKKHRFWILQPRIQDRETCLCIRHDKLTICSFWWTSSISSSLQRLQTSVSHAAACAAMPITNSVHIWRM